MSDIKCYFTVSQYLRTELTVAQNEVESSFFDVILNYIDKVLQPMIHSRISRIAQDHASTEERGKGSVPTCTFVHCTCV